MYHVQGNLHFEIKEEKFKHKLCPMEAFKSTFVSPSSFERDTENSKLWFVIRARQENFLMVTITFVNYFYTM